MIGKFIQILLAAGLILSVVFVALLIFSAPASAEVFVYGSQLNYSEVVLPNNSYVHQGENISQGNYYDLSGIYGFSGELAYWKDDSDSGLKNPDIVIDLVHPERTFIGQEKFPPGRYWQWDGQYCDTKGFCSNGFGHGNAYVFAVVPAVTQQEVTTKTIVHFSNITILQGGSAVEIPVTITEIVTQTPVPTTALGASGTIEVPTPIIQQTYSGQAGSGSVQDQNGYEIPGGVAGAVPVTMKSPVPVWIGIVGLAIVAVWRRK